MLYRNLGKSQLKVSALCLGTMMFGDQTPASEAADIVAHAHANGVNFIDTADAYTKGASEEMLGTLLKSTRHHWVLATKLGNQMGEGVNQSRYSRVWMLREADESLRRLHTDYVDVYYLHRDFDGLDFEEPFRALDTLLRAGKIRYWGLSNFRGWRIAEAVRVAAQLGMPGPAVCQPYYNLLNRMPEIEILPACQYHGIGVVPYSPIARGVLTGKYTPGVAPAAASRVGRGDKRVIETEFREESLTIAQRLKTHAESQGLSLAQFATAWVMSSRAISSVIAGPRTLSQWKDYFAAVDHVLTAQDEDLVDSLVRPGHSSTHGYSDPAYPITGRNSAARA